MFLENPNGQIRDTAQRLMVEHPDAKTARQLEKMLASSKNPLARLHALWTIDGMGKMESSIALAALTDADSRVRAAAIRLCEPYLVPATRADVLPDLLKRVDDGAFDVRLQLALTLSAVPEKSAEDAVLKILDRDAKSALLRDSAISGMRGRELEFLESIVEAKHADKSLIISLSQCVMNEKRPARIKKLLDLAAALEKTTRAAILEGMGPQKGRAAAKLIFLDERPTSLDTLTQSHPDLVKQFEPRLAWPGKPGVVIPPPPRELTLAEKSRYEEGKLIYSNLCAACHQPTGLGQDGLAPPLVDSEWVLGPPARLPRILMHGVAGPISVTGIQFRLEMPGLPDLNDKQIAAVLTYVRREWDHGADPLTEEQVTQVRTQEKSRTQPWTALELLKIK
jgi:mono/diheme cytochrome c family protein